MTLKLKLKNLDDVDESIHSLYKEVNGEFLLQVEGLEDNNAGDNNSDAISKMEAKISKLFKEKSDLKKQLSEKDEKLKEHHKADNNYKALYEQAEREIESLKSENSDLMDKNKNLIDGSRKEKLQSKISDIASNLSGEKSSLMKLVLEKRLSHNEDGDIVVLDESGQPSKLTIDQLQDEIKSNDLYSGLIVATKAQGGGSVGNNRVPVKKENEFKRDRDSRLERMSSYHKSNSIDNLTDGLAEENNKNKDPLIQ